MKRYYGPVTLEKMILQRRTFQDVGQDCIGHEADSIELSSQQYDGVRISNPERPKKFYYLPQKRKSDVLVDRTRFIFKHHGKKRDLESFTDFEFQIYTARMLTLEGQTAHRLMDRDSECFADKEYKKSREEFEKMARKHVMTYSLKKEYKEEHEKLKKRAKENPNTLFLIVADEAHWGMSRHEGEAQNAHEQYVASWDVSEFENVIVLEVSATPYALLTTQSLIPTEKLLIQKNDGSQVKGVKDGIKKYKADDGNTIQSSLVKTTKKMHIVEWNENFHEQFQEGRVSLIQVPVSKDKLMWLGYEYDFILRKPKLKLYADRSDENSTFEFLIENDSFSEVIQLFTVDGSYSLGYRDSKDELFLFETRSLADDKPKDFNRFYFVCKFGEDVFELKTAQGRDVRYVKHNPDRTLHLARPPADEDDILPVPPIGYSFLFYASRKPDETKYTEQYLSLNFFLNTMRETESENQLLRRDEEFESLCQKLNPKTESGGLTSDVILTAEYALFVILLREIRALEFHSNETPTFSRFLIDPDHFLSGFISRKEHLVNTMREKLKEYAAKGPIKEENFTRVYKRLQTMTLQNFRHSVSNRIHLPDNFWFTLFRCVLFFGEECWSEARRIYASEGAKELRSEVEKYFENDFCESFGAVKSDVLSTYETYILLNNLVQHNEQNFSDELRGHMKVVRLSEQPDGERMYVTLCLARGVASQDTPNSPLYFEVIRDYGKFSLDEDSSEYSDGLMKKVLHRILKHLQTDVCQHEERRSKKRCPCTKYSPRDEGDDGANLKCKECDHKHKTLKQYSDLDRLPCILILVSKGRLGSTYPRSMNMMDLRLEDTNKPMYTTCVQELGRLCRYAQKTDSDALTEPYALIGKKLTKGLEASLAHSAVFHAPFCASGNIDNKVTTVRRSGGIAEMRPTQQSYMYDRKRDDQAEQWNRLMLKAEPQIGKTGVFLRTISSLRKIIYGENTGEEDEEDVQEDERRDVCAKTSESEEEEDSQSQQGVDNESDRVENWIVPYWRDMQGSKLPMEVKYSKYARIYGQFQHDLGEPPTLIPKNLKQGVKTNKRNTEMSEGPRPVYEKMAKMAQPKAFTEYHFCGSCTKDGAAEVKTKQLWGRDIVMSIPANSKFSDVYAKFDFDTPFDSFTQSSERAFHSQPRRIDNAKQQNQLESWIFTPTYGRSTKGNLNLYHTMFDEEKEPQGYIHVLVVRFEDFDAYRQPWESSHVIIQLPDDLPECDLSAAAGAVGFARHFIQRLAEHLNLKQVFLLDDNIPYVKEVTLTADGRSVRREKGHLVMKPVLLYKVLKHMEMMMDDSNHGDMAKMYTRMQYEKHPNRKLKGIRSYTGPQEKYAVIGLGKERPGSTLATRGFKKVHVYSLVLLNIQALRNNDIEYKPWPVFEDLTMNCDCEKKDLWVVKMYRFSMRKRNLLTWLPDIFYWNADTKLKRAKKVAEKSEEERVLLSWLRLHVSPKAVGVWPQTTGPVRDKNLDLNGMTALFDQLQKKQNGRNNIVLISPNPDHDFKTSNIVNYFRTFVKERLASDKRATLNGKFALIFPFEYCLKDKVRDEEQKEGESKEGKQKNAPLVCKQMFETEIVDKAFEKKDKVEVLCSHNVTLYQTAFVLLYVQGRVKRLIKVGDDINKDASPIPVSPGLVSLEEPNFRSKNNSSNPKASQSKTKTKDLKIKPKGKLQNLSENQGNKAKKETGSGDLTISDTNARGTQSSVSQTGSQKRRAGQISEEGTRSRAEPDSVPITTATPVSGTLSLSKGPFVNNSQGSVIRDSSNPNERMASQVSVTSDILKEDLALSDDSSASDIRSGIAASESPSSTQQSVVDSTHDCPPNTSSMLADDQDVSDDTVSSVSTVTSDILKEDLALSDDSSASDIRSGIAASESPSSTQQSVVDSTHDCPPNTSSMLADDQDVSDDTVSSVSTVSENISLSTPSKQPSTPQGASANKSQSIPSSTPRTPQGTLMNTASGTSSTISPFSSYNDNHATLEFAKEKEKTQTKELSMKNVKRKLETDMDIRKPFSNAVESSTTTLSPKAVTSTPTSPATQSSTCSVLNTQQSASSSRTSPSEVKQPRPGSAKKIKISSAKEEGASDVRSSDSVSIISHGTNTQSRGSIIGNTPLRKKQRAKAKREQKAGSYNRLKKQELVDLLKQKDSELEELRRERDALKEAMRLSNGSNGAGDATSSVVAPSSQNGCLESNHVYHRAATIRLDGQALDSSTVPSGSQNGTAYAAMDSHSNREAATFSEHPNANPISPPHSISQNRVNESVLASAQGTIHTQFGMNNPDGATTAVASTTRKENTTTPRKSRSWPTQSSRIPPKPVKKRNSQCQSENGSSVKAAKVSKRKQQANSSLTSLSGSSESGKMKQRKITDLMTPTKVKHKSELLHSATNVSEPANPHGNFMQTTSFCDQPTHKGLANNMGNPQSVARQSVDSSNLITNAILPRESDSLVTNEILPFDSGSLVTNETLPFDYGSLVTMSLDSVNPQNYAGRLPEAGALRANENSESVNSNEVKNTNAGNNNETSNTFTANNTEGSNINAGNNTEASNTSARNNSETSNTSAGNNTEASNTSALKNTEANNTSTMNNTEASNTSAMNNTEANNTSALNNTEANNTSTMNNTEASNTSAMNNTEANNTSAMNNTEASNTSAMNNSEASSTSAMNNTEANNTSAMNNTEANNTCVMNNTETSNTSAGNNIEASNTTAMKNTETSNTSAENQNEESEEALFEKSIAAMGDSEVLSATRILCGVCTEVVYLILEEKTRSYERVTEFRDTHFIDCLNRQNQAELSCRESSEFADMGASLNITPEYVTQSSASDQGSWHESLRLGHSADSVVNSSASAHNQHSVNSQPLSFTQPSAVHLSDYEVVDIRTNRTRPLIHGMTLKVNERIQRNDGFDEYSKEDLMQLLDAHHIKSRR